MLDKPKPPVPRQRAADPKVYARAKASNDTKWLADVDGRTLIARRYRDIVSAILVDQGGEDRCSESRKQLIRRFAAAACLAEAMEAELARGEEIDINQHGLLCSTMVRVANKIGIDRTPLDITPSLGDLIRADQEEQRARARAPEQQDLNHEPVVITD